LEEAVSYLLSFNGVNVNCEDTQGHTLLFYVAKLQHSLIAHLLITSGADVNMSDKDNLTPLMYAAMHGYKNITRDLLASGRICVDCQDRH
jgi:ankyrin repeat protein